MSNLPAHHNDPPMFSDLKARLHEATQRLVQEHRLAVEQLTERQLASAIAQAIQSGDFTRHIRVDGSQLVTYVPYAEAERLRSQVAHLRERLQRYGITEEEEGLES